MQLMLTDLLNVRIKEHFGLITNDTNTTQFRFLVSPPKNRKSIEIQDIVCFDHPIYGASCQVLAEVKEITSYEEVAGSTIGDRIGKMLATAKIVGYIDLRNEDKPLHKLLVPPNPGSRVYMPYASFLEDVLNRGTDGKLYAQPLHLGKTEIVGVSQEASDQQINYYLDGVDLTSKHTLISAVDGAGKTYTATIIIEELANKTSQPMVIFDPNNEYAPIAATLNPDKSDRFQNAIINANTQGSLDEIVKKVRQGQVTIITAENLSLTEKREYYTNVLNALAKSKREKTLRHFLLIIEDAENILPQAIHEMLTLKDATTMLITSHPSLLGGETISKIGNEIVGKINDLQDLTLLKNLISCSDDPLCSLGTGEWVINGLNMIRPTKIRVRERLSNPKTAQVR